MAEKSVKNIEGVQQQSEINLLPQHVVESLLERVALGYPGGKERRYGELRITAICVGVGAGHVHAVGEAAGDEAGEGGGEGRGGGGGGHSFGLDRRPGVLAPGSRGQPPVITGSLGALLAEPPVQGRLPVRLGGLRPRVGGPRGPHSSAPLRGRTEGEASSKEGLLQTLPPGGQHIFVERSEPGY